MTGASLLNIRLLGCKTLYASAASVSISKMPFKAEYLQLGSLVLTRYLAAVYHYTCRDYIFTHTHG